MTGLTYQVPAPGWFTLVTDARTIIQWCYDVHLTALFVLKSLYCP